MQTKKMSYFLSTLLLLSGLIYSAGASTNSVSFRGVGVTIDLIFPEEAHPNETTTHNMTITAHSNLLLQSFTLYIYAPVNATWQEVKNQTISSFNLLENQTLASRIEFQLPQDTNGTVYCEMTVQTDKSPDYSAYRFYTTHVSKLTFSEMQNLYYEMLANYTTLQADYEILLNEYNGVLANYSSLFANYTALVSKHNELLVNYNGQVAIYESLLNSYNSLSGDYDALNSNYRSKLNEYSALQGNYDTLNSTDSNLQANYTSLRTVYGALNQTYTQLKAELGDLQQRFTSSENAVGIDRIVMLIFLVAVACLIALIIYIKRKQPEPYVVIRKETVAIKPEKD